MKHLIKILLIILLISCTKRIYLENTGDFKETFVVEEKRTCGKYTKYTDYDYNFFDIDQDNIYHKRDVFQVGDTLKGKEVFFNKYLKYELWDKK